MDEIKIFSYEMKREYELIRTAYLILEGSVGGALARFGLSNAGFNALAVLAEGESVPITHLARRLLMDDSTATRVVDAVERSGLVRRIADPVDRRIRRVEATPYGRRVWRQASEAVAEATSAFLSSLSNRERERFTDDLIRLTQSHLEESHE